MKLLRRRIEALPGNLQLLKKVELFSDLKPRELRALEPIIHERCYVPEEIVFEQGQEGLGMYVLIKGKIRLFRHVDGHQRELALLEPGAYFGELALLDGSPRAASAVALEDSSLIGFFRPEFLEILETHGRIGAKISLALARTISTRLRQTLDGNSDYSSL